MKKFMMLPVLFIWAGTCKKKMKRKKKDNGCESSYIGSDNGDKDDDDDDDDGDGDSRRGTVTTYCSEVEYSSSSTDDGNSCDGGRLITSYYHYSSSTSLDEEGDRELVRCKYHKKDYRDIISKHHGVVVIGKEKMEEEDMLTYYRDCVDELLYENTKLCKCGFVSVRTILSEYFIE
jgi:hypothetical protein